MLMTINLWEEFGLIKILIFFVSNHFLIESEYFIGSENESKFFLEIRKKSGKKKKYFFVQIVIKFSVFIFLFL